MTEEWRSTPGYEGFYEVSSLGRVRSVERRLKPFVDALGRVVPGRRRSSIIRSPHEDKDGYLCVHLNRDGKRRLFKVHLLVALAFIGPRPAGLEVCHNNGQQQDNRPDNIRYDTTLANHADRKRHGTVPRGENHYRYKGATA